MIRQMTEKDREEIIRILRSTPEFTPAEVEVAIELIDLYLRQGEVSGYYILVAEEDMSPVGYICYGPTPMTEGTWDIYWIDVDAAKQRRGTGRTLLEYAEDEIKKAGGRLILIETSSKQSYEKTRKFYDSLDYSLIASVPDFYMPGDDKLILGKAFQRKGNAF